MPRVLPLQSVVSSMMWYKSLWPGGQEKQLNRLCLVQLRFEPHKANIGLKQKYHNSMLSSLKDKTTSNLKS